MYLPVIQRIRTEVMRPGIFFRLAVLVVLPSFLCFAGSYPPANFIQTFDFADTTSDLADGSALGSDLSPPDALPAAAVVGGALRLADKSLTNSIGSFRLPDLDPRNVIKSFDVKFSVAMNRPAVGDVGEGWSINFGDIPGDNGTGEGGFAPLRGGITISFDPANDPDDPPSIEVFIAGVSITNVLRTFVFDTIFRPVLIHWDSSGLDLSYENKIILSDLAMPGFSPGTGHIFAFTARTTTATMDVLLDDLKATTTALPVIETGGPVISEFVANNDEFEDEFADKPGWLEILNGSPQSVDLAGWYLSDSKQNLKKWRIERLFLSPYNYQVVFASGRDRQLSTTSFLHTSFSIAKKGGFIALVRPDGTIASSFEYAAQDQNVSYGEKGSERKRGYMYPASPGVVNTAEPAAASRASEVSFSHPGGFVSDPLLITLSTSSPGAEIRYTLDRTEPGSNSLSYSTPITVTQFVTIRARAYAPDHLPGPISSRTYVLMDSTLTNYAGTGKIFDSNIPIIYLDSYGFGVDSSGGGSHAFRPTYALVIAPDPATGRASLTNQPDYSGPAGTHVRGESSAGFDQKSYALELWDEAAKDHDASLLGMPADSDWVIYGPWSEKTLMRNKLIFDWTIALRGEDGMAVRSRFVEVFFNQSKAVNGRIGYASYKGIFVLMEKLKRGKERVPLESLNDKTIDPELITGGYIIRKDKTDTLKNNWSTPRFSVPLQSFDPDRMNTPQLNYVKDYLSGFETALNGSNFRNFASGYQAYIDADTFIDAQWMLEIAKQVDGYVFSTYWHKDRAGRLRAGPLWDFNISLGNADYAGGDSPVGWYSGANGTGQIWYPRLHLDPDYRLAHWDRYWEMRRSILASNAVVTAIDRNMATLLDGYTGGLSNRLPTEIQNPAARHFRRWPRLGSRDWPNPAAETKIKTYQEEVDYMKNFIRTRLAWIDDQSMRTNKLAFRPPVLSHEGGTLSTPIDLIATPYSREEPATQFATGDIFYTLDSSDPRLPGGEINPRALRFNGPVSIWSSCTFKARLYAQKIWSPLATATYLIDAQPASSSNLVISELMFRPASLSPTETAAGLVDSGHCEFIELKNISAQTIDLAGVRFTKGIDFDFGFVPRSSQLLQPGESVVIAADKRAFMVRYPTVPVSKIVGQFRGHLDSGGESIALQAANGRTIKDFRYDDDAPWPTAGDSTGRSLVLRNAFTNPNPNDPTRWTVSSKPGGTPTQFGTGSEQFTGDPARDTDGDGQSDLFEFATGSDPENPHSVFPPSAALDQLQQGRVVTLRLRHRAAPQGVSISIERSSDLRSWSNAQGTLILAGSQPELDGTVTDTYQSDSGGAASFYRVKVAVQ